MKFGFVAKHRGIWPVRWLCETLGVSRSGFHAGTVPDSAEETVRCLLRCVPAAVTGTAFLSGGQAAELASARLDAINPIARAVGDPTPWSLVFSFARANQEPALQIWRGKAANIGAVQQALYHRANCNHAAIHGNYTQPMETTPALRKAS